MNSFFYRSARIGKSGKTIEVLKIKTLRDNVDRTSSFAEKDQYLWYGRFLRKTKLDEISTLWNVLRGDLALFGYRPEEERTFKLLPEHMQEFLKQHKPGLVDLASLHFFDEEFLLQQAKEPAEVYWKTIRPMKYALQVFYHQNKCFLLDLAIAFLAAKKILSSFFKKV